MSRTIPESLKNSAAPVALPPSLTTTLQENLAVKKFLEFALADIGYQLGKMSRDRSVPQREFNGAKDAAVIISTYLVQTISEIERLIAEVNLEEDLPKDVNLLN